MINSPLVALSAVDVPPQTPGVYVSLLATGEVKIGVSTDILQRHRALGFEGSKILGVLPAWRGIEADLHAAFRAYRSRRRDEEMFRETYHPVPEICAFVRDLRARGFTPEALRDGGTQRVRVALAFDNGELLFLELTYLLFLETGTFVPRYVLQRACNGCGATRSSLDFLNTFDVQELGERQRAAYLVLQSSDRCTRCQTVTLPSDVAFAGGQTRLRLGSLRALSGEHVQAYDRDALVWAPLIEFGIRRMAKSMRESHPNDANTLRMQPCRSRHGKAQGRVAR